VARLDNPMFDETRLPTQTQLDIARDRIADLEHAARSAADILHTLSMATSGSLRGNICSASNILDHALGRQQSLHGVQVETKK